MQLMPATAKRFSVHNRFDSAANIEGRIRYLRWLSDHFQGHRALATAAYFTGEERMAGQSVRNFSPEVLAYVRRVYFHLRTNPQKLPFGETAMSAYPFGSGFDPALQWDKAA
jgi:transglycosylase-like protein with SLT domain